jgi:glycine betaine/choline ABC-type transport system substrate-binding protein
MASPPHQILNNDHNQNHLHIKRHYEAYFGVPVNARRFRLSLLAAGLFSLSFTLAESVTIGGANFTESSILANIYASALKKNIEVKTRLNLGNREIIIPALKSGEIDIVPEYLGALLNYYDGKPWRPPERRERRAGESAAGRFYAA